MKSLIKFLTLSGIVVGIAIISIIIFRVGFTNPASDNVAAVVVATDTKDVATFDIAIPLFEKTAEGQAYIKKNGGLPKIYDAWNRPPIKNTYQFYGIDTTTIKNVPFLQKIFDFFSPFKAIASPTPGTLPGQYNCKATPTTTGYFKVFFEDMAMNSGAGNNLGYDHPVYGQARRNEVCSVLEQIGSLLKLDTTTVTPDILFAVDPGTLPAGALAAASSYFGYETVGADNGALHKHIITHTDPTPTVGSFDAFVYTKFGGVASWSVDSTLNAGTYDFKTVMYHEVMHALGFRGELPAVISATNIPFQHGTFDENTYGGTPPTATNKFFTAVTNLLHVPIGAPSPWFINNINVYQGTKNVVGATPDPIRPVYSPSSWQQGSSLSHFDMTRAIPKVYMMNPDITPNTARSIHQDEKEVLCHLGYMVNGLTGCTGPTPVANDDTTILAGTTAPVCVSMLTNDSSFGSGTLTLNSVQIISLQTGDTITYYSGTGCTGATSTTPNGNKSLKLTPVTSTTPRTLHYTVKASTTNRISFPAQMRFGSSVCTTDPSEYVCNGDFELGSFSNLPIGYNGFFDCPTGVGGMVYNPNYEVPFWCSNHPWTPDLVGKNMPYLGTYHDMVNLPYNSSFRPSYTIDMVDSGSYASLNISGNGISEKPVTKLKSVLVSGHQYTVSFDLLPLYILSGTTNQTINADLSSQYSYSASQISILSQPVTLSSFQNTPTAPAWQHISHVFTAPQSNLQYLSVYVSGNTPTGASIMSYIDNVSIVDNTPVVNPTNPNPNSISGTVFQDTNTNGLQNTNELGLAGTQVGLFVGSSATPVQTVTTQNIPNLGKYTFSSLGNISNYRVALMNENIYPAVTLPPQNAPIIIVGYNHVYTIPALSGNQNLTNKNFGVGLSANSTDLTMSNLQWTTRIMSDPTCSSTFYGQASILHSITNPYVAFKTIIKNNGTNAITLNAQTVFTLYKGSAVPANTYSQIVLPAPVTLAPNTSYPFCFSSSLLPNIRATVGTFQAVIEADSANTIPESDETNNTLSVPFVVY